MQTKHFSNYGDEYIFATLLKVNKNLKHLTDVGCRLEILGKKYDFKGEYIYYPYIGGKNTVRNTIACKMNYY